MRWAIWASLPVLEPHTMFTMNTCRAHNRACVQRMFNRTAACLRGTAGPVRARSHTAGEGEGRGDGGEVCMWPEDIQSQCSLFAGRWTSFSHAPTLGLLSRYRRVWLGSLHPGLPQSHLPHVWGPRVHSRVQEGGCVLCNARLETSRRSTPTRNT